MKVETSGELGTIRTGELLVTRFAITSLWQRKQIQLLQLLFLADEHIMTINLVLLVFLFQSKFSHVIVLHHLYLEENKNILCILISIVNNDWLAKTSHSHLISVTVKSLSEFLIFASINPQYDNRLFMELP